MNNAISIIFTAAITLFIVIVVIGAYHAGYSNSQAYNDNTGDFVGGVHFPKGAFCVNTAQSIEELNDSYVHEGCHALIAKDYEHFCGER